MEQTKEESTGVYEGERGEYYCFINMKEIERFSHRIKNVDPDEWKEVLEKKINDKHIYQVQDLDDRFRYAVQIDGIHYYSTFYIYKGMTEKEEQKAFNQVTFTLNSGWYPTMDIHGATWKCAYCGAMAANPAACNQMCPCRK